MGRHTIVGNSPVSEKDIDKAGSRVPPDTRNPVGSRGDHPPSLNTTWWPIVKSTVMESWKEPRKGSEKESETLCLQAAKAPYECDSVLFVERSGELRRLARLSTIGVEPKGDRVWIARTVCSIRPETGWPNHGQVEVEVKFHGGPNPRLLKKAGMSCG